MAVLSTLWNEVRGNWKYMLLFGAIFALLFQVFMMLALIVRFQNVPNYVEVFDWIGNVAWIIQSTPSWRDVPPIVYEEWLIEIGYMNYDYGMGISEWSLNVIPSRLVVLTVLGAAIGLCLSLTRRESCSLAEGRVLRATTGLGAVLVAMTNATMSWVVCCATPSWVVGLAMLGLGVSTSLSMETMGPALTTGGFGILTALALFLAWRKTYDTAPKREPVHA